MKLPDSQIVYVDRPELTETYVNSIQTSVFDGRCVKMELCITRLNEPKPPEKMTARKYPACRLVLDAEMIPDLYNQLTQMIAVMEKEGLVKREGANIRKLN